MDGPLACILNTWYWKGKCSLKVFKYRYESFQTGTWYFHESYGTWYHTWYLVRYWYNTMYYYAIFIISICLLYQVPGTWYHTRYHYQHFLWNSAVSAIINTTVPLVRSLLFITSSRRSKTNPSTRYLVGLIIYFLRRKDLRWSFLPGTVVPGTRYQYYLLPVGNNKYFQK